MNNMLQLCKEHKENNYIYIYIQNGVMRCMITNILDSNEFLSKLIWNIKFHKLWCDSINFANENQFITNSLCYIYTYVISKKTPKTIHRNSHALLIISYFFILIDEEFVNGCYMVAY